MWRCAFLAMVLTLTGCSPPPAPAPEAPSIPPVEQTPLQVQTGPRLIRSSEWALVDNWLEGERVAFNAMVKRDREDLPVLLEFKAKWDVKYVTLTIDGASGPALTGPMIMRDGRHVLVTSIDLARAEQIAQARKVTLTLVSAVNTSFDFTPENIAAMVKLLDEYKRPQ